MRSAILAMSTLILALGCGGIEIVHILTVEDAEQCAEIEIPSRADGAATVFFAHSDV